MSGGTLVALSVAIPLLAAAALPVFSRFGMKRPATDVMAIATALASLAIDLVLLVRSSSVPFVYWFGGWTPAKAAFPLGIPFLVEPVAAGAATLAALLTVAGLVFSSRHFDAYGTFYHSLLLVFLAAMTGFCVAADIFNQFVFFELMGVAAYALTGYKVEDTGPLEGALNFAVINSMGAISILMGIGLVYGLTGSLTMVDVGRRLAARGADVLLFTALALFLCGYFVKGAVFPFHFWLPDAHAVAPTAASVLFSGIMVETAVVGGFRTLRWVFSPALGAHEEGVRAVILGLGAGTALLAAVMALLQRHLKRLLAYSTISHVGIVFAAMALLTRPALAGSFVYLFGHGALKGALFCCTGIVLHRKGSVDDLDLHGRCKDMKACALIFFAAALGLLGLPPFATFTGKGLMEEGAKQAACHWFPLVAAAATALTSAAIFRAGARIFLGIGGRDQLTETASVSGSVEGRETDVAQGRTPLTMLAPAALLVVAALGAGVAAVARTADAAASLYLNPAAVEALVLRDVQFRLPPGEALVVGADLVTIALATAGAAVLVAWAFLARGKKGRQKGLSVSVLLAKPLREIHSGHVGDYATWFVLGAAFLLVAFSLS